ncbi:MAG TPA: CoA pyrophosphatase [Gammaproteobacteria bacterium]
MTSRATGSTALQALIEKRLASAPHDRDAREAMLANVEGEVSAALREVLAQPAHDAAVLMALVERPGGLTVLFTERAPHLAHHPGQVSFPGGRIDGPDEDAVGAALREAWEEIRLPPADVRVAGLLPRHVTGTGFMVTPVVGFVHGRFRPSPDPAEVASVFEVPLDIILAPGSLRTVRHERHGTRFRVHELEYEGRLIWGATAAMLVTFKDLISDE